MEQRGHCVWGLPPDDVTNDAEHTALYRIAYPAAESQSAKL